MLNSVGSDLTNIIHINVFLKDMLDFDEMNRAYIEMLGDHRLIHKQVFYEPSVRVPLMIRRPGAARRPPRRGRRRTASGPPWAPPGCVIWGIIRFREPSGRFRGGPPDPDGTCGAR